MAFIIVLFLSARRTEKIDQLTHSLFLEMSQSQFFTIDIITSDCKILGVMHMLSKLKQYSSLE